MLHRLEVILDPVNHVQAYPEHIESKELIKQLKAHFSSL